MPPDTRESRNQVKRSDGEVPGNEHQRQQKSGRPLESAPILISDKKVLMHNIDAPISKAWCVQGRPDTSYEQVGLTFCISWLLRGLER